MRDKRYTVAVATKKTDSDSSSSLCFRDVTMKSLPEISRILHTCYSSRTCDYTVGGIFMWIKYFSYQYCIVEDTLFIRGDLENHPGVKAFSLPVGPMPIEKAINMLKDYCKANNETLRFSAIPEDRLTDFRNFGLSDTEELTDWADYLYEADALASFSGKKLSKKRNHFNRFVADNPNYMIQDIRDCNINDIREAYSSRADESDLQMASAIEEHNEVFSVLENLREYPFEGIVLRDESGSIAGFTMGEVIADTLYVHIEKINKDVAGAGETINRLFVERMKAEHPEIRFVNREEDTGDEGLRRAKESYHPVMMLRKYNIFL